MRLLLSVLIALVDGLLGSPFAAAAPFADVDAFAFSEARAGLKSVMDDVCNDHTPTVITRVNGEHVVMLSLSDYNSIEETLYLLGTAKNASRLMASVAQIKAGKAQPRALARHEKPED